jgi:hypothetical protein
MKKAVKPRRRGRGRPRRKEATEKALAELSVDPIGIDPRAILASIAVDTSAPASARVAACRALLSTGKDDPGAVADERAGIPTDATTRKAIALMAQAQLSEVIH